MAENSHPFLSGAQRNIFTGILTIIPIWFTWLVFDFFLAQLSKVGSPWARGFSIVVERYSPTLGEWLLEPWFQSTLAVVLTIVFLYVLGWATNRVVGRRMIRLVELLIGRIPLVHTIYGGAKKLLAALQQKPDRVQRVVLIEFPSPEMKTVGFVTRVMRDHATGKELAAVYVPTTPNPTSGYLEIVPLDKVVSTNWTMDEAMTFIISGGAISPETMHYTNPESSSATAPETP